MARPRQPIELIKAKGKAHLTKAQIEAREKHELKVDLKDITIPKYLPSKLKKEFEEIAFKLLEIGVMTELDEDCLARYLLSKQSYLQYTSMLNKATVENDIIKMEKLMTMQDKEIYLSSVNNDNTKEFHMVFRYFDKDCKKLIISKGNFIDGYEVYNYYYNRLDASVKTHDKLVSNKPSKPTIGMSELEVRKTEWGAPDKINRNTYSWGTTEQWVYNSYGYVYFENGKVTSISER